MISWLSWQKSDGTWEFKLVDSIKNNLYSIRTHWVHVTRLKSDLPKDKITSLFCGRTCLVSYVSDS